jgi:rhodanese-related sulfurtransferase
MIGSPYQITRSDKKDERGFCVVDLEDLSYEFIDGEKTIKFIDVIFPEEFDEKLIKGNVIDVTVNYDGRLIDNDLKTYIEEIEKLNPAYPPNIFVNNSLFDNISENIEIKTLSEMFDEFVGNMNIENKKEIKEIINDLFIQAKGK